MTIYHYEATNFGGETIKGDMEANCRNSVVDHLARTGYIPLTIYPITQLPITHAWNGNIFCRQRLSERDVVFFTQELAVMLKAGLSLERSLSVLFTVTDKIWLKSALDKIIKSIRGGYSLSEAISQQKLPLPCGYTGMLRAGEAGGSVALQATLERLSVHLEKEIAVKDKIFSAMMYPCVVICIAILSILIMLLFVVPKFEPLFNSIHGVLPFSTQVIISLSHSLSMNWQIYLLVGLVLGFSLRFITSNDKLKPECDKILIDMPKIGPIIVQAECARFCSIIGNLLASGIALASAMSIASSGMRNVVFANVAKRCALKVREGESLSLALSQEKVFPQLSLQLIRIGEETSHLDSMLLRTADVYDQEVRKNIDRTLSLLTPAITIILGVVIAVIIVSILSAILSVNDFIV